MSPSAATAPATPEIGLLRFLTCGSVDDGKSTLIGRLLYDTGALYEDQVDTLTADSQRVGTRGREIDYALLLDGLAAEREQGITIDVAYRYFQTARRKFIVADTPGHEQYTRNMVTGASTADLAVILVDASRGVLTQTRRHSYLAHLLGIRRIVLAVNKMDLIDYDPQRYAAIVAQYEEFAAALPGLEIRPIPVSGVHGDNITAASARTPWYDGPTLLAYLESVPERVGNAAAPFRLPVQWVNRPDSSFRGYAGTVVSGTIAVGERIRVLPSGRESRVARIVVAGGDLERASADQAVTLTLADEIDISRGDVISAATAPVAIGRQFEATIVWMHDAPLLRGRSYLIKLGTRTVGATIAPIKHKLNINTLEELPAEELELNEIGVVEIEFDQSVAYESFAQSRDLGGFIVIDRLSNATVGAGMLHFALRRSDNLHWQAVDIDKAARAAAKHQRPCVLWFTGLSGAGKSTIANQVEKRLHARGQHTYLLDGDNVRHGLNKDLGFTEADRVENIRRVAEVARLMVDAGLIVMTAFISPFRSERDMARRLFADGEFIEVFVDTSLAVAESRDVKGLYKKARRGDLKNFTGIDSPYEPPLAPDLRIDTQAVDADGAAAEIVGYLERMGRLA